MKLTYIYPPLFKPFLPMATRLITCNLLRDKRLQAEFSDIPIRTYTSGIHEKLYSEFVANIEGLFHPNVVRFLNQKYILYNIFYVLMSHGYYDDYLPADIESDYAMVTVINYCDLIMVKKLLKKGKKVMLGGPLVNIGLTPPFIRTVLYHMDVKEDLLNTNLIVVSGNIDLSTDLYQLLKDWKDAVIDNNNYGTLFQCGSDFLHGFYDESETIPVHFGFHNRCWYAKCRFCTYKLLPKADFLNAADEKTIIEYFHRLLKKFNSNQIRFIDSYFRIKDSSVTNILEAIKQYHITVYTGILLLKNREYIDFLNKYVNVLLIGLESTSDFSLKRVNKGYTYKDILEAFEFIRLYLNRNIYLELSIILDLPAKDTEDVKNNYRNIAQLQEFLLSEGFKVGIHLNILSVHPNMELLYEKDPCLKISTDQDDFRMSSGKNYLIYLLRQAGMDKPSLLPDGPVIIDEQCWRGAKYGYLSSKGAVMRYDINGNILPSDLLLMEEGVMDQILKKRSKKS